MREKKKIGGDCVCGCGRRFFSSAGKKCIDGGGGVGRSREMEVSNFPVSSESPLSSNPFLFSSSPFQPTPLSFAYTKAGAVFDNFLPKMYFYFQTDRGNSREEIFFCHSV